ncbi:MAG: DmsE family decaheme c-type cytochrome [Bryobacterales bacterium]|nr:DmsE family decaheme c-type cytochrome [Bryobacterales bacterium]
MTRARRLGPLVFWLAAATATGAPTYVGSATCRRCHPDVVMSFSRNPHYKAQVEHPDARDQGGCESCHGPASEHVAAGGGKSNLAAFSVMPSRQVLDACLRCHSNSLGRASVRGSSHSLAQIACNQCHSVHKSPVQKFLLAREQRDLCYGCHQTVKAQFSMPFKHRVNEGFMSCADCHNPHGAAAPVWRMGARPRMTGVALQNEEPCLKCHTDKRGPFAFEHSGVRVDGCETCHSPHGSAHPRLLRRPAVFTLCLECHSGAGNFGRQGDGINMTSVTHSMTDPKFQNCTACHTRIHGSNADERFLR